MGFLFPVITWGCVAIVRLLSRVNVQGYLPLHPVCLASLAFFMLKCSRSTWSIILHKYALSACATWACTSATFAICYAWPAYFDVVPTCTLNDPIVYDNYACNWEMNSEIGVCMCRGNRDVDFGGHFPIAKSCVFGAIRPCKNADHAHTLVLVDVVGASSYCTCARTLPVEPISLSSTSSSFTNLWIFWHCSTTTSLNWWTLALDPLQSPLHFAITSYLQKTHGFMYFFSLVAMSLWDSTQFHNQTDRTLGSISNPCRILLLFSASLFRKQIVGGALIELGSV